MSNEYTDMMMLEDAELRSVVDDGVDKIRGIAIPFERDSLEIPFAGRRVRERVAADADVDLSADIYAVHGHGTDNVLGRVKKGTMRIDRDADAIRFEITPGDTSWGVDAVKSVARGDLAGASIRMTNVRSKIGRAADGIYERTLNRLKILHVALVAEPAYPDAVVEMRNVAYTSEIDEFERMLRINDKIKIYGEKITRISDV